MTVSRNSGIPLFFQGMKYYGNAMYVVLNGKFVDERKAAISALDHGFLYGDGVYETLRTYGGKVWQIGRHMGRLESSAGLLKIDFPWSREKIEGWVNGLVKKNGYAESRIRVTVTRGANGMVFDGAVKPTILIQAVELKAQPARIYKSGVGVITVKMKRIMPRAKTISLLPMVLAWQQMKEKKAYEAVYVDEKNNVLEGTVTNVFAVKKGVVYTPKNGVLPGTTREAIMTAARRSGIKMKLRDFKVRFLRGADEVFISNAPRGIVPVRSVDGVKVGGERKGGAGGAVKVGRGMSAGCPGPVTRSLMKTFEEYIWKNI